MTSNTPTGEPVARLDLVKVRERLQSFDFQELFVEELGWSRPSRAGRGGRDGGILYRTTPIAELAGVVVLEIQAPDGDVPRAAERALVFREVSRLHHENLLLFVDKDRAREPLGSGANATAPPRTARPSVRARADRRPVPRVSSPGWCVELAELDVQGKIPVTHVAGKLRAALDVERVTRRFFEQYGLRHEALVGEIGASTNDRDRRWYASVL